MEIYEDKICPMSLGNPDVRIDCLEDDCRWYQDEDCLMWHIEYSTTRIATMLEDIAERFGITYVVKCNEQLLAKCRERLAEPTRHSNDIVKSAD